MCILGGDPAAQPTSATCSESPGSSFPHLLHRKGRGTPSFSLAVIPPPYRLNILQLPRGRGICHHQITPDTCQLSQALCAEAVTLNKAAPGKRAGCPSPPPGGTAQPHQEVLLAGRRLRAICCLLLVLQIAVNSPSGSLTAVTVTNVISCNDTATDVSPSYRRGQSSAQQGEGTPQVPGWQVEDSSQTQICLTARLSGKEPACQCRRHETRVRSLGQEDPLEEGMATHSRIPAWRIPWTEEPGGLQSRALPRVGHD